MNLKCNFCSREYNCVRNYLSHYRLHKNVKNLVYDCCYENCNGKFTRFTSLKSHISRNHGSQSAFYFPRDEFIAIDYVCTVFSCQKKVKGRKNIIAHMKSHMPEQSITCPFENCKGLFSVKSSFTSHASRKHRIPENQSNELNVNSVQSSSDLRLDTDRDGNEFECYDDEIDKTCMSEEFERTLGLALLKFETVNLIPVSTLDDIIANISLLHNLSQVNLKENLRETLKNICNSSALVDSALVSAFEKDFLTNCLSNSSKVRFNSNFKRLSFYKNNFGFIEPIEMNLGLDENNQLSCYQYIPLKKTIEALLSNDNIRKQIDSPLMTNDDVYCDVQDGQSFKNNKYFIDNPSSLKLILYQDAFEIVNPLGSAKKAFKLVGFYFTFADFYPQFRSKIDHLQLALLCKESDLDYFGLKVIDPLIRDLKELSSGVTLSNGRYIKANLVCILGDNLGSHWIGGFTTNFGNAEYLCRYCLVTKDSFQTDPFLQTSLRSKDNYVESVQYITEQNVLHHNGIKSDSILNSIPGFHVCNPGMPPCLGHDVFEGVVKYDLALFIKEIVTVYKWFDVCFLNSSIKHVPLGGSEASNRPAKLSKDMKHLKGHAVQNWTLLRLLPVYVGDKILESENNIWNLILLLREIAEYLCAYKISANQIAVLQSLIWEYIEKRKLLFPNVPLRPKHHYLMHYPWLIYQFGPLLHVWTMRFESKHTFFKRCVRNFKNLINVTKTLAVKHQLLQTYCHQGNVFDVMESFGNLSEFDCSLFSMDIQIVIRQTLPNEDLQFVQVVDYFMYNGIKVKNGCVFALFISHGEITFGMVEMCVVFKGDILIICKQYPAYRSELGLYDISMYEKSKLCMLKFTDVLDQFPLMSYKIRNKPMIALKHQPFDPMDYLNL